MKQDGRGAILAACTCLEVDNFWTQPLPENAAALLPGDKVSMLIKWMTTFQANGFHP